MRALLINCTLKASPEKSNTEALAEVVAETDDNDRPVAYNHVAAVVVTGNEDGAVSSAL